MNTKLTVTEKSLAEQMQITDREIESRKKLTQFDDGDIVALTLCKQMIIENVDQIVGEFYENQVQVREISLLIGDSDTFSRLRLAMRRYVIELFEGYYDAEYVNKRLRIGKVHKRIGVSPKYYVSAIRLLESILQAELAKHFEDPMRSQAISALHKLILFDVQLVFDTYIASLVAEVASAKDEMENYAESLEQTIADRTNQLKELSRQDSLTKLNNQGTFHEELRREIAVAERQMKPLTLVYFDLNGFKEHNDTQGHRSGDEVLSNVGDSLREVVRDTDIPCRYGGDEFCIIVPGSTAGETEKLCDRLVNIFKEKECGNITFSIGVAEYPPGSSIDSEQLIKKADALMYQSKTRAHENPGFHITSESSSKTKPVLTSNSKSSISGIENPSSDTSPATIV